MEPIDYNNYAPNMSDVDAAAATHLFMKQALLDQHVAVDFADISSRHNSFTWPSSSSASYNWTPENCYTPSESPFSNASGFGPSMGDDMDFKLNSIDQKLHRVPQFERTYTDMSTDYFYYDPLHTNSSMRLPSSSPDLFKPESPMGLTNVTNDHTCTEGCAKRTFGRRYELFRHIKEQHRCPHEDCVDVKLVDAKAKRDHERLHKQRGSPMGHRCGSCLQKGFPAKALIRREKLKKHFKESHGLPWDFDVEDFQCKEKECSSSCGGLYFITTLELQEHHSTEHSSPIAKDISLEPLEQIDTAAATISGPRNSFSIDLDSSSGTAKRARDDTPNPEAKRPRPNERNGTKAAVGSSRKHQLSSILIENADFRPDIATAAKDEHVLLHQPKLDSANPLIIELPPLQHILGSAFARVVDQVEDLDDIPITLFQLHSLSKRSSFRLFLRRLRRHEHIACAYDRNSGSLKFRSSEAMTCQMKQVWNALDDMVGFFKKTAASEATLEPLARTPPTKIVHQRVSSQLQQPIHPIDVELDRVELETWEKYVLPVLPAIVRQVNIGTGYSATLVRQAASNGIRLIIRIRSRGNQGLISRRMIKDKIRKICEWNHCPPLDVQFTQGWVKRLTGTSTAATSSDDPANDTIFPHQQRPWVAPGMGASMSLSQCRDVTATLGGYIIVDDEILMLSVDHFISSCRCGAAQSQMQSPSMGNLNRVQEQLLSRYKDLELNVHYSAPIQTPLEKVSSTLFPPEINEEFQQYKQFKRELDSSNNFELGRVRHRSGNRTTRRPSTRPHLADLPYRPDWSLCEITENQRQGKNRHRHGRTSALTADDISNEVLHPEGLGALCQATGTFEGGERVHYVGTASGYREGVINAAPVQFWDEKQGLSCEWSIVVPGCENMPDSDFHGDSGAWILNDDNEVLGMLWGWDNGSLLFTDIHDVFADIQRTLDCGEITLPVASPASTPERPSDTSPIL